MQGKEWEGLDKSAASWTIELEDIEVAIKHSNNSMNGPDGIPYKAWRKLGKEGAVVLHEVAKVMQLPEYQSQLLEAYERNGSVKGSHDFNLGSMCCLPRVAT